jgi:hypothetical protein
MKICHDEPAPISADANSDMKELVQSMLYKAPARRPSMKQVAALPFMSDFIAYMLPVMLATEQGYNVDEASNSKDLLQLSPMNSPSSCTLTSLSSTLNSELDTQHKPCATDSPHAAVDTCPKTATDQSDWSSILAASESVLADSHLGDSTGSARVEALLQLRAQLSERQPTVASTDVQLEQLGHQLFVKEVSESQESNGRDSNSSEIELLALRAQLAEHQISEAELQDKVADLMITEAELHRRDEELKVIREQQQADKSSKDAQMASMKAQLDQMKLMAAAAEAKEAELTQLRQQLAATQDEPSPRVSPKHSSSYSLSPQSAAAWSRDEPSPQSAASSSMTPPEPLSDISFSLQEELEHLAVENYEGMLVTALNDEEVIEELSGWMLRNNPEMAPFIDSMDSRTRCDCLGWLR